ncbi:hypothetical protein ACAG25_07865 [Mycobacterium sp. pV006]|uniref:hypothetical protein n=1 Tax=Mycobacterium sp. pV006 TaxID=3238983 RepID=UPI00351B7A0B
MDPNFGFLGDSQLPLLLDILSRRNPRLYEHLRHGGTVSRSDADELVNALGDELATNMDDDWEPTEGGQTVSALPAHLNAVKVAEWP